MSPNTNPQETIRRSYSAIACGGAAHEVGARGVATAFGYDPAELDAIPAGANLGLSCGNPTALAGLREGEIVVDLGCGGGIDVFLAARQVGPTGQAIGIDMTEDMLARARENAQHGPDGEPFTNVEFHLATIDQLPLQDESVDCVISNCVINLAPDKPAVFREIARVLKPGGRLAISDIALKQPLPPNLAEDIGALVGCIAGANSIEDNQRLLQNAGFTEIDIIDAKADLNAYSQLGGQSACCAPAMDNNDSNNLPIFDEACTSDDTSREHGIHTRLAELLSQYDINSYAASIKIFAVKWCNK